MATLDGIDPTPVATTASAPAQASSQESSGGGINKKLLFFLIGLFALVTFVCLPLACVGGFYFVANASLEGGYVVTHADAMQAIITAADARELGLSTPIQLPMAEEETEDAYYTASSIYTSANEQDLGVFMVVVYDDELTAIAEFTNRDWDELLTELSGTGIGEVKNEHIKRVNSNRVEFVATLDDGVYQMHIAIVAERYENATVVSLLLTDDTQAASLQTARQATNIMLKRLEQAAARGAY